MVLSLKNKETGPIHFFLYFFVSNRYPCDKFALLASLPCISLDFFKHFSLKIINEEKKSLLDIHDNRSYG